MGEEANEKKPPSGVEKLVLKAREIIKGKRISQLDTSSYEVKGDHGVYIVSRDAYGNYNCSCLGYLKRRICSHSLAVRLYEQNKEHRRMLKKRIVKGAGYIP
ncbi:MAG: hypothetical protein ACUVQ0_02980 [Thermoproteota archaeon]